MPPDPEEEPSEWDSGEQRLERGVRRLAMPVALGGAFLMAATGPGRFLLRLFCGMWVHEFGHALTAWACGFLAFPGPWFTPVSAERSTTLGALISAGLLAWAIRSWLDRARPRAAAALILLGCQLVLTHGLAADRARMWIIFGGDAACLWLGALLIASVYAPAGSWAHRGWIRFGLLGIGAAAFADVFSQWWAARSDPDRIPFGENEGQGLSDPSRLSQTWGWSSDQIVGRYLTLGLVCLAALGALYLRGLRPAAARRS